MANKVNLFQKFDEKIAIFFNHLIQTKLSKLNDFIENNSSEQAKKIIHLTASVMIPAIPLLFCFILYISNKSSTNKVNEIHMMIRDVQTLESQEALISRSLKNLIPTKEINSTKSFSQHIYNKLRSSGVSLKDIQINTTDVIESIGDVNVVQIEGQVKSLGTKEITRILNVIQKMKPTAFNEGVITKNEKNNLLDINFSFDARAKK